VTPRFTFRDVSGAVGTVDGAAARAIAGVVSTRTSAAGKWGALLGKTPVGFWEFTLPNDQQTKNRLENGEIENVLLAITYAGRTPEWPA
jgi:hypothetical protein